MTGSTTGHTPAGGNSVPGDWDITTSVGVTALAVAAARAEENERPDALAHDPWAGVFVRAAEHAMPTGGTGNDDADEGWSVLVAMMAVRTRVLDDLLAAAADGGVRQVVVLAAGLDARAHRLPWPDGTTVYEVDQAPVLEFKQRTLDAAGATPSCRRRPVPCDLREDWVSALREAGFDASAPTCWLVEGLLPYLPADAEAALFAAVDALSAPGSRMAIEAISLDSAHDYVRHPAIRELSAAMGTDMVALWNTEVRTDVVDRLHQLGWTTRPQRFDELGHELGRPFTGSLGELAGHGRIIGAARD